MVPDYPASDEEQTQVIPFPFARYRGKILRADDQEGVRARVLEKSYIGFDFSGGGSFPANSDENEARQGMNDLDWTFQLGPRVYFELINKPKMNLRFVVPLRFVLSTDFGSAEQRGWLLDPGFFLTAPLAFPKTIPHTSLFMTTSSTFATQRFHDYFFTVAPQFVNSTRSEFKAEAGYLGSSVFTGALWQHKKRLVFLGVGFNSFHGSANTDSPLFRSRFTTSLAFGFGWKFYESEQKAYR